MSAEESRESVSQNKVETKENPSQLLEHASTLISSSLGASIARFNLNHHQNSINSQVQVSYNDVHENHILQRSRKESDKILEKRCKKIKDQIKKSSASSALSDKIIISDVCSKKEMHEEVALLKKEHQKKLCKGKNVKATGGNEVNRVLTSTTKTLMRKNDSVLKSLHRSQKNLKNFFSSFKRKHNRCFRTQKKLQRFLSKLNRENSKLILEISSATVGKVMRKEITAAVSKRQCKEQMDLSTETLDTKPIFDVLNRKKEVFENLKEAMSKNHRSMNEIKCSVETISLPLNDAEMELRQLRANWTKEKESMLFRAQQHFDDVDTMIASLQNKLKTRIEEETQLIKGNVQTIVHAVLEDILKHVVSSA